jgi:DNA polymerase-3 subunit gamma/tau
MAYTVLARKYRPQSFEDLVGQEHVARTLANAIQANRVAHAFLFTGVRGVGKTTTARLLAKALNCEKGPTATPCNVCGPCTDITAGVNVDVQEIDGASNNSVDDVRRLQESLPYRPQRDRFKIVIVDEVHMLSAGAFNAFLKTLEEPPDHVKFIFATTESHKVPVTIRSRCQQYDFRLIPQRLVAERVRDILAAEGIEADDESVLIVAREAAGSMRDALTLLDQLVAISDGRIDAQIVAQSLGIANREALHEVADALLHGDGAALIGAVSSLAEKSVDMLHFARQLLQLLRDLVVLKLDANAQNDWVPEDKEAALGLIEDVDLLELQRAFRATSQVMDEMTQSADPKLMLEMGLVRVATRPPLQDVSTLLSRLEALQGTSAGGGGGSAPEPQGHRGSSRPKEPQRAVGAGDRASAAPSPKPPQKPIREAVPAASPAEAPEPSAKAPEPAPNGSGRSARASEPSSEPDPAKTPPTPAPAARTTEAIKPAGHKPADFKTSSGATLAPLRRAALQEWERLIETMSHQKPALAAVLEHGVPKIVSAERIVLSFQKDSFYGRQAEAPDSIAAIRALAERQLGGAPQIDIRFDAEKDAASKTVAAVAAQRREADLEAKRKQALNHPTVKEAIAVFPESAGRVDVHIEAD